MSEPKKPTAPAKKTGTVKGLSIVAKRDSFRRAGHAFGAEAKEIPLSDLSKEQIEQLRTDPMLVCVAVDIGVELAETEAE